jgi:hypothetical protein
MRHAALLLCLAAPLASAAAVKRQSLDISVSGAFIYGDLSLALVV